MNPKNIPKHVVKKKEAKTEDTNLKKELIN